MPSSGMGGSVTVRTIVPAFFCFLCLLSPMTGTAVAQEEETLPPEPGFEDRRSEEHDHHIGVFLGATRDDSENDGTVGVDYHYRVARFLSAGGTLEHAGGRLDTTVLLGSLWLGPMGHVRLVTGAGFEESDEEDNFLVRLGIAYEIEFGRFSIAPELNVDFVEDEEIEVFGLSFGFAF